MSAGGKTLLNELLDLRSDNTRGASLSDLAGDLAGDRGPAAGGLLRAGMSAEALLRGATPRDMRREGGAHPTDRACASQELCPFAGRDRHALH